MIGGDGQVKSYCNCLNILFVILMLSAAEALWLIDTGDWDLLIVSEHIQDLKQASLIKNVEMSKLIFVSTGFECRCGNVYCGMHRYSDVHSCSYNYKADAAEKIRKENPVVVGEKIQKIWTAASAGIQNPLTICRLNWLELFSLVIRNVEQCILPRPFNHACHQMNRFCFCFCFFFENDWTFIFIAVFCG